MLKKVLSSVAADARGPCKSTWKEEEEERKEGSSPSSVGRTEEEEEGVT